MSVWHEIGTQLAHPSGAGGWAIGHFMRLVNDKTNRLAVERLGIAAGDRVLELGCGPGHGLKLALEHAPSVVHGVDQSSAMLQQARHRNRKAVKEGRIRLHWAHFDTLPVKDESIDKALAVNVIYFWHDMPSVAADVLRVLRPGGKLSIYATGKESMRNWKFTATGTHRLFDAPEFERTLAAEGFGGCRIVVSPVAIAPGIRGLIAEITKAAHPGG